MRSCKALDALRSSILLFGWLAFLADPGRIHANCAEAVAQVQLKPAEISQAQVDEAFGRASVRKEFDQTVATSTKAELNQALRRDFDEILAAPGTEPREAARLLLNYTDNLGSETGVTLKQAYELAYALEEVSQKVQQGSASRPEIVVHVAGSLGNNNWGRIARGRALQRFAQLDSAYRSDVQTIISLLQSGSTAEAEALRLSRLAATGDEAIFGEKAFGLFQKYQSQWENFFKFLLKSKCADEFQIPWWSVKDSASDFTRYGEGLVNDLDIWIPRDSLAAMSPADIGDLIAKLRKIFDLPEGTPIDRYETYRDLNPTWVEEVSDYRVEYMPPINSLVIDSNYGIHSVLPYDYLSFPR